MEQYTNNYEIRLLALKRSGNHAIVQWMLDNIDGRYCFLNNCRPGKNPFFKEFMTVRGRHGEHNYFTNVPDFDVDGECRGRHCRKDYLIYSYEDRTFDEIDDPLIINHRERNVGTSAHRLDVMVLRDPFNNVASKIRMSYDKNKYLKHRLKRQLGLCREFAGQWVGGSPTAADEYEAELIRARDGRAFVYRDAKLTAELWKAYARELLGETSCFPRLIWVNYNRWFSDPTYREELAETLHLAGADGGVDRVPAWGAGSSFDNLSLDGRAADMRVLERWKQLVSDEIFRTVLQDAELHELSRQLFGEIPGTEVLRGPWASPPPEQPTVPVEETAVRPL